MAGVYRQFEYTSLFLVQKHLGIEHSKTSKVSLRSSRFCDNLFIQLVPAAVD